VPRRSDCRKAFYASSPRNPTYSSLPVYVSNCSVRVHAFCHCTVRKDFHVLCGCNTCAEPHSSKLMSITWLHLVNSSEFILCAANICSSALSRKILCNYSSYLLWCEKRLLRKPNLWELWRKIKTTIHLNILFHSLE
jgi:hypothetical protein